MTTKTLSVPNISCGHCVMTIKRELNALSGVYSVEGDVDRKEITVTFEPDSVFDKIKETLTEIGYPPA